MRLFPPEEFQSRRKKQGGIKISRIIVERRFPSIEIWLGIRALHEKYPFAPGVRGSLLVGSNNIRGIQIMGGGKGIGRTIINIHLSTNEKGGETGRDQVSKGKIGRKTRGQVGFLSRHGMESSTRGHE